MDDNVRLSNLRAKYYPGHHLVPVGRKSRRFAIYRVVCQTWDEYLEAREVMPRNIEAKVLYKPKVSVC